MTNKLVMLRDRAFLAQEGLCCYCDHEICLALIAMDSIRGSNAQRSICCLKAKEVVPYKATSLQHADIAMSIDTEQSECAPPNNFAYLLGNVSRRGDGMDIKPTNARHPKSGI